MREVFETKKPSATTLAVISSAIEILEEYAAQGYDLTLRQLFYQFVARGLIENTQKAYKRVGTAVATGRMTGLINWNYLVDRGRSTHFLSHWDTPAEIVQAAAYSFRIDKWEDQPNHVEVMVEKDALSGVLAPVCEDLDVRFTANKGYSSLSHFYRIGKRIERVMREGKEVWILYLGDHDPSGLDMDRDILERLETFSWNNIDVDRLALTMKQVDVMNPPENPAKLTDSRAGAYVAEFGYSSWELDAIEPSELASLVTDAVVQLRDDELWNAAVEREEEMRDDLQEFVDGYD